MEQTAHTEHGTPRRADDHSTGQHGSGVLLPQGTEPTSPRLCHVLLGT